MNPYTNRKVSIVSEQGKFVLGSYLYKQSEMSGGLGLPNPTEAPGGAFDPELYTERMPEDQLDQRFYNDNRRQHLANEVPFWLI